MLYTAFFRYYYFKASTFVYNWFMYILTDSCNKLVNDFFRKFISCFPPLLPFEYIFNFNEWYFSVKIYVRIGNSLIKLLLRSFTFASDKPNTTRIIKRSIFSMANLSMQLSHAVCHSCGKDSTHLCCLPHFFTFIAFQLATQLTVYLKAFFAQAFSNREFARIYFFQSRRQCI